MYVNYSCQARVSTSVLLSNKQCVQNNTLCTLIVFVSALFPLNGCQEIKIKTFQCLQLLSTFKPLRCSTIPPMGSIILVNRENVYSSIIQTDPVHKTSDTCHSKKMKEKYLERHSFVSNNTSVYV